MLAAIQTYSNPPLCLQNSPEVLFDPKLLIKCNVLCQLMSKYLIYEVREVLCLSIQHLGGLSTCRQWANWYSSLPRAGIELVLPVAHEFLNLWFALGGSLALWYSRWAHQAGQREQRSPTIVNAV